MPFDLSIEFEDEVLKDLYAFQDIAPDLFRRKVPAIARRVGRDLRAEMKALTPPSPASKWPNHPYPLRWASERQRRYVMALLRSMGGPPYRRTGELEDGWHVRVEKDQAGSAIYIENDAPHWLYVYGGPGVLGQWQQPFHQDIGWPDFGAVFESYEARIQDEVEVLWTTLVQDVLGQ
jgi:hypothetical protein